MLLKEDAWLNLRGAVAEILRTGLQSPEGWTIQGLGMLRFYMSEDHSTRLHVWESEAIYKPAPSAVHSHPWALFTSLIVSGQLTNIKYLETPNGAADWVGQEIKCGRGGCSIGEPHPTSLILGSITHHGNRSTYEMVGDEIHLTRFAEGTVSIIEKTGDTETARVFWPKGEQWVSAETRDATAAEVERACRKGLKRMGLKP